MFFCFLCSGELCKIFMGSSEKSWKWLMPHKSYVTYDMAYATVKFTEDIEQGKFYRHDILKLKEILELFDLVLLGEDAESREMAPLLLCFCMKS